MKRLFALLIAVVFFPAFALADLPDLSFLTYDELLTLRAQIDACIFYCPEFKSVTVPEGVYQIGKDIPAGDWNMISVPGEQSTVVYFEKLDAFGVDYDKESYYWWDRVCNIEDYEVASIHLDMKEGMYVHIGMAPVIFTPYTGPAFSFE